MQESVHIACKSRAFFLYSCEMSVARSKPGEHLAQTRQAFLPPTSQGRAGIGYQGLGRPSEPSDFLAASSNRGTGQKLSCHALEPLGAP